MLVCAFLLHLAHETAGRIGRPASLRPILKRAGNFWQTSGAPRREIAKVCLNVIARSAATKQSTLLRKGKLDCFASLAMTDSQIVMAGLVPAIHVFDVDEPQERGCPAQGRA
jgi:hypothetical protein